MSDIQDSEGWLKLRHGAYVTGRYYKGIMNSADLLHTRMISVVPWGANRMRRKLSSSSCCHELEKATRNFVSVHLTRGWNEHQGICICCNNRKPLRTPQCLSSFMGYSLGLWFFHLAQKIHNRVLQAAKPAYVGWVLLWAAKLLRACLLVWLPFMLLSRAVPTSHAFPAQHRCISCT